MGKSSLSIGQERKRVSVLLSEKENEIATIKAQISDLSKKMAGSEEKRDQFYNLLQSLKCSPSVSEHAILRYIERVKGFDLSVLEKEIMTEKVVDMINYMVNGRIKLNNGHEAVIKDKTVVTIV